MSPTIVSMLLQSIAVELQPKYCYYIYIYIYIKRETFTATEKIAILTKYSTVLGVYWSPRQQVSII